jgi:hypothetical protein
MEGWLSPCNDRSNTLGSYTPKMRSFLDFKPCLVTRTKCDCATDGLVFLDSVISIRVNLGTGWETINDTTEPKRQAEWARDSIAK